MLIDGIKRSPAEQAMRNVVDLLFALYGYLPLHPFIPAAGQPAASITFRSVVAHEFRFIAAPICADCVPRTMGCVRTEYLSARRDSALVVRVKAAVCRAAVVGTPGDRFH